MRFHQKMRRCFMEIVVSFVHVSKSRSLATGASRLSRSRSRSCQRWSRSETAAVTSSPRSVTHRRSAAVWRHRVAVSHVDLVLPLSFHAQRQPRLRRPKRTRAVHEFCAGLQRSNRLKLSRKRNRKFVDSPSTNHTQIIGTYSTTFRRHKTYAWHVASRCISPLMEGGATEKFTPFSRQNCWISEHFATSCL